MNALIRLVAVMLASLGLHSAGPGTRVHLDTASTPVRSIRIESATGITTTVTRPRDVRRIVKWFDALPPFVARPCPYPIYQPPDVRFDFRLADGSSVLRATDHAPGTCAGAITYGDTALAEDALVARVSKLLGVDVDPNPRTARRELAARRDTPTLLRLIRVPAGSRLLPKHSSTSLTGTEISRAWTVGLPIADVLAFEKAHPPHGSSWAGNGTGSFRGRITDEELEFSLPSRPEIASRGIEFKLIALRDGGTQIRVGVGDTWSAALAPDQVVPAGVRTIEIRKGSRLVHRVTWQRNVAKIVRWFDGITPGKQRFPTCFGMPPQGPSETMTFLDGSGHVLMRVKSVQFGAYVGECYPMSYSIRGRTGPPLIDTSFLPRVERLLR